MMGVKFGDHFQDIKASKDGPNDPEIHQVQKRAEKIPQESEIAKLFRKLWRIVMADNDLTLHGFRRFRSIHLFNIRFLEEEIDKMAHPKIRLVSSIKSV